MKTSGSLWRLKATTSKGNIAQYCLDHQIAAMGWSLLDEDLAYQQEWIEQRNHIHNFDDYRKLTNKLNWCNQTLSSINALHNKLAINDLIWMRCNGLYYLGRVLEGSTWHYHLEALSLDAANQRDGIDWQCIGDESSIPGIVLTSFIGGYALQRINNESMLHVSQYIYNEKKQYCQYDKLFIQNSMDTFYDLLSPDECEDILCMWLYRTHGYICIPSTNKRSTQCYECVLIDPATGNHIYIQVKKGKIDLYAQAYSHLSGDVWLLTTQGRVIHDESSSSKIHTVHPAVLYEFAMKESLQHQLPSILPDNILRICTFLHKFPSDTNME